MSLDKLQVEFLCGVTPYSNVVRYHCHFTRRMEVARTSEMSVSYHITTLRQNPEELNLNLKLYHCEKLKYRFRET
jgi:hypothetical protein